jgi:hypothetical protein
VSAIILSDVAIAVRLVAYMSRIYKGSAARRAIISHLDTRLKPVKAARSAASSKHDHDFWSAESRNESSHRDIFSRIAGLLLHCCNTRDAIEAESCLVTRSSLVIHFAEAQDKFTSEDPAF